MYVSSPEGESLSVTSPTYDIVQCEMCVPAMRDRGKVCFVVVPVNEKSMKLNASG